MWLSHPQRPRPEAPLLAAATAGGSPPGTAVASNHEARRPFAADARTVFLAALRAGDMVVVAASAITAYWARIGSYHPHQSEQWEIATGCLLAANLLQFARLYSIESLRHRSSHVRRLAGAWALTMLAVVATIYFTKTAEEVSRGWVLLWGVMGFVGLIAVRAVAWSRLASRLEEGKLMLNMAVVGDGAPAERLARHLERSGDGVSRVLGIFSLTSKDKQATDRRGATIPDVDDLAHLARNVRIDEIAISIPCPDAAGVSGALTKLGTIPINVKLCLDLPERACGLGALSLPAVPILERPLAGWPIIVKRCMDVAISAVLLVFFAPVMALVALAIKLDSTGPVLFRQQRHGFNKDPITVYKFRTMDVAAALDSSVPQARRHDPRVTRIGRFLRRSSIDELPQLLNVLTGAMSLVGPRPHAVAHDEQYAALIDGYLARHRVRPGITGWAQVNGYRGETDTIEKMARRVEHDLYYIDHWSPFFDLHILFRTLLVGFRNDNAY